MSSPENKLEQSDRWDRILSHQLQHWVDNKPFPENGRQRLLQTVAEEKPSLIGRLKNISWPQVIYRRISQFLPKREQVPFPIEDFVHSVTISSPLVHGVIFCT